VPPDKGGAIERWIRDAARLLAARGHDVHVVSRDHGDQARRREIDGVTYHFIRIPAALDRGQLAVIGRGAWYFTRAAALAARLAPQVVHHHSRPASVYAGLRRGQRARHVLSLHSMRYGWTCVYGGADRSLFRAAFRACARVLPVSDFIKRHALQHYPELEGKIATLYNGVDGRTFHPRGPEDSLPTFRADCPTILYVGRVEERKGVHVLLEAFERMRAGGCQARLRIVGPHSYWSSSPSSFYASFAERCRRLGHIELRAPTYVDEELASIYRSATVSVVPSVFPEALGLTSLEAQASGVPVIVSNAGGLPETVRAGESGLVVEQGDADALASATLTLLGDPARAREMGRCARAWAMERFSWDRIASQLEVVYAEVAPT
jgi:glycosyltransferase involved in cell wall biosynthesis